MSPRTLLLIPIGALLLLSACGAPPKPPLKSPPLYVSPSAAPISLNPSALGVPGATFPTPTAAAPGPAYPTYTYPTAVTTTVTQAPDTVPATPTPSHAAACTGSPTDAQLLTLIKGQPGIPNKTLQVDDGPYCSGEWSFSTVEITGASADQLEPLMVVTTGRDTTLALVAAGSEVCTNRVLTSAPPGIRVLACGS
ncbi:hypothetical protein [Paractinoplanes toevensis]|uniref:Uncharacterized protein n=1 Tax=Paractinoplanes toevensis TaxID=571911 RepID=A0A919VY41_9ACTN|nr:hypothetical protein [Actinoplanes toevensis]GIM88592.1 hypothetical protein Ato02nite_003850 [Actinoplanes toevensis]